MIDQEEKQIGVLIAKLACNEVSLREASELIQQQLDLHKQKSFSAGVEKGMTDAAEIVKKQNVFQSIRRFYQRDIDAILAARDLLGKEGKK